MTREEAKKYIYECLDYTEATEVIKALEQEPCEDCVSRQAVDELSRGLVHTTRDKADFLCNFWEGLRKLPPVTPTRKKGKWVDGHCSECGCDVPAYMDDWKWIKDMDAKYCPNCGAEMEGEE